MRLVVLRQEKNHISKLWDTQAVLGPVGGLLGHALLKSEKEISMFFPFNLAQAAIKVKHGGG